jgi:hypothetical protein
LRALGQLSIMGLIPSKYLVRKRHAVASAGVGHEGPAVWDGDSPMARRDPVGIRLLTRRVNDWAGRFPNDGADTSAVSRREPRYSSWEA